MKLCELQELLNKALAQVGPNVEVLLSYEERVLDEGYDEKETEGISDVRVIEDWPLPGTSLLNYEGEKPKRLVILYDNHYKLDSSAFSSHV